MMKIYIPDSNTSINQPPTGNMATSHPNPLEEPVLLTEDPQP